jgi:hypothetical protein
VSSLKLNSLLKVTEVVLYNPSTPHLYILPDSSPEESEEEEAIDVVYQEYDRQQRLERQACQLEDKLCQLRDRLLKEINAESPSLETLGSLVQQVVSVPMTIELLKKTKIGRVFKQLQETVKRLERADGRHLGEQMLDCLTKWKALAQKALVRK